MSNAEIRRVHTLLSSPNSLRHFGPASPLSQLEDAKRWLKLSLISISKSQGFLPKANMWRGAHRTVSATVWLELHRPPRSPISRDHGAIGRCSRIPYNQASTSKLRVSTSPSCIKQCPRWTRGDIGSHDSSYIWRLACRPDDYLVYSRPREPCRSPPDVPALNRSKRAVQALLFVLSRSQTRHGPCRDPSAR